jgi:5-methylcytosine-specific restriction endonuclease McrA
VRKVRLPPSVPTPSARRPRSLRSMLPRSRSVSRAAWSWLSGPVFDGASVNRAASLRQVSPRHRLGLREGARPRSALSGRGYRRGTLPSAIPAAGERILLREGGEGQGEGSRPSEVSHELGRLPEANRRIVRRPNSECHPQGAQAPRVEPASPWLEAPSLSVGGGKTAGVHGLHRARAGVSPAVLSDTRRGDGGIRCPICGVLTDLTVDHILPRCLGGPDSPSNRRQLCRRCNSVKGGRIVSDDALRWYRAFERLSRWMGLGLDPPHLGCVGPAPTLNRLAQFSIARARESGA